MGKPISVVGTESIENLVIDTVAITQWLNRETEWPRGVCVTDVAVQRLWRSGGGHSTFELRLTLKNGDQSTTALLQGGQGAPLYPSRPKARCNQRWLTGLRLVNRSLGVWVCAPDRDPALRLRTGWNAKRSDDSIVAYRIGKRCVVHRPATAVKGCGWYLKFFARRLNIERLREIDRASELLDAQSNGFVRAAPVVAVDREARMIATREVRSANPPKSDQAAAEWAAWAACELHDVASAFNREHSPMDEIETVRRWEAAVACHQPFVHLTLGSLVNELLRFADALPDIAPTTIHRDFYADQLLFGEDGVWLLDMDTLCMGHREQDIATYCAHLLHEHRRLPHRGRMCAKMFLDAYEKKGPSISHAHLRFYLCAAIARITLIHALRGLHWSLILQLWATARATLYEGVEMGFDRYLAGATADR